DAGGGAELAGCCGEDGALPDCAKIPMTRKRKAGRKRQSLFRRSIITRLGVNPERRQALRRKELHFYLTPFAVSYWVLWTVGKQVLVAQLNTNFRRNISQVVRVIDGKGPSTSQFRDIAQKGWTKAFFVSRKIVIVDTDGIDEDVRLFHHRPNFTFRVAAVIVS